MKKIVATTICTLTFVLISLYSLKAQTSGQIPANLKPVKNVIILIPDGTSTAVLSLARWYQSYSDSDIKWLHLDELVSGLVKTHCSDSPIGDSAPTGSTYATGVSSQTGYVATHPEKTPNDVIPVDASLANTPAFTILEAAKLKGLSTGLVFTCDYTHATPADFSSHTPNRSNRIAITPQMVHNKVDVVFGGGADYLLPEYREYLAKNGYDTIFCDYNKFKAFSGNKAWALVAPKDIPYDIDRNPNTTPSLAQMTKKAIETLAKNEKGFFLMVEGSKVDFAAHGNDPIGVVTEFLAFDKAVKEALDFAKKDGQTAIVICPDHGNSGINIGNSASTWGYSKLTKNELFSLLTSCKLTISGFTDSILMKSKYDEDFVRKQFADYMGINDLTTIELQSLKIPMNWKRAGDIYKSVVSIVNSRTFIGFTTGGHTGEDVFLGCYHPQGQTLKGVVLNTDVNKYMCQLLGIGSLADSTKKYFASHTTVFPESEFDVKWDKTASPTLTVQAKASKKILTVKAFDSMVTLSNGPKDKKVKQIPLSTVAVYVVRNDTFYLPRELAALLK